MQQTQYYLKNITRDIYIKRGDKFIHYRNNRNIYKVLHIALDEESEKPVVVYQALYGSKIIWTRKLDNWLRPVKYNNKFVERFNKIN